MKKKMNVTVIAALFGAIAMTTPTRAWVGDPSRTTYLTFTSTVALPGVQLTPGTYIFEVANPDTSADVVRVSSRDRSKVYLMAFTHRVERPAGLSTDRWVTFGETRRGGAASIKAWFPAGEQSGHEFIYHE